MADQGQHNECVTQAKTTSHPEPFSHRRLRVSKVERLLKHCNSRPPGWVRPTYGLRTASLLAANRPSSRNLSHHSIWATRAHPKVALGLSLHGMLIWQQVAQAWSLLKEHPFVTPDDVQEVGQPFATALWVLFGVGWLLVLISTCSAYPLYSRSCGVVLIAL